MPLKDYTTREDYDSDYRLTYRTSDPVALSAARIFFFGRSLRPDPPWPQVRHGGEVRVSLGKGHPNNTIGRVIDVDGDTITLDAPVDWTATTVAAPSGAVVYAVPEIRAGYLSAVLRPGTYRVIDALVAALGIATGARVAVIGCGLGWEVERLVGRGFDAIGVETSRWIHEHKRGDESQAVEAALIEAGYDPTRGEGAALRAAMLSEPCCKVPDRLVEANIATPGGREKIERIWGRADWAISVGVMQTLDDREAEAVNAGMMAIAQRAGHYITVIPDVAPHWNGKSAEDWKARLAPALIVPHGVAAEGYRVI